MTVVSDGGALGRSGARPSGPGAASAVRTGKPVMRPLLIALGVDLAVMAAAMILFGRSRSLRRQPGEFAGVIRVPGGVVGGLKWRRGWGRWVATSWPGAGRG
jgi:hypothetical protein